MRKFDAHVVIGGRNGVGKSMLMLAIMREYMKKQGPAISFYEAEQNDKIHFLYTYHTRDEFSKLIRELRNCIFGIDELKVFFDHRRFNLGEQMNLYNTVELARSHTHFYVGCTRELDKILLDYRNAKCGILIRLLDRVEEYGGYVYGMVFIGNEVIEREDKFMQAALQSAYSFREVVAVGKQLHTFVGMIVIKDIHSYGITEEDLHLYDELKERGIQRQSNIIGKTKRKRGRPRKAAEE
ncbi:Uncharacterised protein [Candidatus Anstonella stagnisolia]|nr:Uncharacterised protein [Candidatus Anstonella stagnisolia]